MRELPFKVWKARRSVVCSLSSPGSLRRVAMAARPVVTTSRASSRKISSSSSSTSTGGRTTGAGKAVNNIVYVQSLARKVQVRITAEANGIRYQLRQPGGGGTDAGAVHLAGKGIPAVALSTPGRYLHTAAAIVNLEDWRNTVRLARAALEALTPEALKSQR